MAGKMPKSSKICVKCGRVLPINEFYSNRDWKEQSYHDAYCRDCSNRWCTDKESTKQYFKDNNRVWSDTIWDMAANKAQYYLSTNGDFLKAGTAEKKKMMDEATVRQVFVCMNLKINYRYADYSKHMDSFEAEKDHDEKSKIKYDSKWRGYYTEEQIKYLDEKYAQYEDSFVLNDINIMDYARQVCKASLHADDAYNKMLRGEISVTEYRDALKIFDDLSKSSNFAACRRKPGETSGMGSLGEIILKLEIGGALGDENPFRFPEDDVDKIIADFRHTLTAVGAQL